MSLVNHAVFFIFVTDLFLGVNGQQRGDQQVSINYIEEAGQILNTVFHKYNVRVPPRKHFPKAVMLSVDMQVRHIAMFDLISQSVDSLIDLQVSWSDSRLGWYSSNVKDISIPSNQIWLPDLTIDSAISKVEEIANPNIIIKSTGQVHWYRRLAFNTLCKTNSTATSHPCEIAIGSNLFDDKTVDFNITESSCSFNQSVSSLALNVFGGDIEKRSESHWLKDNATYPELVCHFTVTQQGGYGRMVSNGFQLKAYNCCSVVAVVLFNLLSMHSFLYVGRH